MKTRDVVAVFNRGRISRLGLARSDVDRINLSAEEQTNWMPRTLGSMMLRPGLKKHGTNATVGGNGSYIPFIFDNDNTAIVEMTRFGMRVWDAGDTRVTRSFVTAAITNGTFDTDLTGWTDNDVGSAASTWATGGYMQLLGTGTDAAKRAQQVTITGGEEDTDHALRIVIERGPLLLRIGTTSGADDLFPQAALRAGVHSINFNPGGAASFFIEFSSTFSWPVLVDSVAIETGVMTLPTPWITDVDNRTLRWDQSGDVIFVASNVQQRRIERRENGSWSLVLYQANDGPYLTENTTTITLTPSAITGEITLTASRALFKSGHVGCIYKIGSNGQFVSSSITAENTWSNPIRVTGVTAGRKFTIIRSGTWSGTITLQRSVGEPGAWADVTTYTTNGSIVYDDGLDNSVIYYRIGIDTGDYTSGTADVSLSFDAGSIDGVVRVTAFTSATSVTAVVVTDLGGTEASDVWAEGAWSDVSGWPTAVALYDGRLWWAGNGRAYGSVSDGYTLFDPAYEGDAGPINRTVGDGQVNKVNFLLPMQRLVAGTDAKEQVLRSSQFDEPITPSNYNSKAVSTKGSSAVPPAVSGTAGYFVGKNGTSLYEMLYEEASSLGYKTTRPTLICPEIGASGIVKIGVQQEPDVRVHCILADGTAFIMVREEAENVLCLINIETDGDIEDVAVLPGDTEDRVFYRVKRTIGGSEVRYHEEMAREDQCVGGELNFNMDSFLSGSGVISGLDHLEGETVVVWADGVDQGSHVVTSGALPTLTGSFTAWCAGLGYSAMFKSAKLTGQTQLGFAHTQRRRINSIGLMLADTHAQGLQFGPSYDVMDDLPLVENGAAVSGDYVWNAYDEDMIEFPGEWDTDSRICLVATAPRPCTVLAAVLNVDRQDHD